MVFTSPIFLFLFFPSVFAIFIGLATIRARTAALLWLLAASLVFYGWWSTFDLALLCMTFVVNYWFGEALAHKSRKWLLATAITFNLVVLGVFKYTNFLISTAASTLNVVAPHIEIALPLAISFYTFQQIAYVVDIYKGKGTAPNFIQYSLFLSFFPHAIAGPIIHHADVVPQFKNIRFPTIKLTDFVIGFLIFLIGFDKKVIIADSIAVVSNDMFARAAAGPISTIDAWAGALAYSFQIYFDFSGYSDMAIGLARMFGILLPLNFHSPYKAENIILFWRRWHMTLSRWLRDYLYVPLGGSRDGTFRRYINLSLVMLLGGLWHGAAWTFVAWGALHGIYLIINHMWRHLASKGHWGQWAPAFVKIWGGRLLTLIAVVFAWVFFRAPTWDVASHMAISMFGASFWMPTQSTSVDTDALIWIAVLLSTVWLLPSTQELFIRYRPALDFPAAANEFGTETDSSGISRWINKIPAEISIISFVMISITLTALISHARGSISSEFIYMIF